MAEKRVRAMLARFGVDVDGDGCLESHPRSPSSQCGPDRHRARVRDFVGLSEKCRREFLEEIDSLENPRYVPFRCALMAADDPDFEPSAEELRRWEHREEYGLELAELKARANKLCRGLRGVDKELYFSGSTYCDTPMGESHKVLKEWIARAERAWEAHRARYEAERVSWPAPESPRAGWVESENKPDSSGELDLSGLLGKWGG